jgi:predicted O-methyltransferase YrrM
MPDEREPSQPAQGAVAPDADTAAPSEAAADPSAEPTPPAPQRDIVELAYRAILRREPKPAEREHADKKLARGETLEDLLEWLLASKEAERYKHRLFMPAGHFYSPIVDAAGIAETFTRARPAPPAGLRDVDIDIEAMTAFWTNGLAPILATSQLPEQADGKHRYHFANPAYSYGDGSILRAMILAHRPRRIVEVGSGWSSACMLDAAFDEGKLDARVAFVEPYPALLKSMLRPEDEARVTIHECGVQQAPLEIFEQLEENDILFIDSTHVVKTGSDVVYELTEVLPRLKPGVLIHFHDIFYPFEYSYQWVVEQNRSWNEIYALRNFLAFNNAFKVVFFNDMFLQLRRDVIARDCPLFLKNSGGAIWLKRVA